MGTFTITQTPDAKDLYLYPENNGCINECFPDGDNYNFECVNDDWEVLEPETDYVFMDGASTVSELYAMGNHGTVTGTINYVKAHDKAKSDRYPPHINAKYKVAINKGLTVGHATATFRPDADGAFSQWIPLGGGSHYVEVDEAVCDNGTTDIREGTTGDKDYFGLPNHTTETGTITKVEVFACCGNGPGGVKLIVYDTSSTNRLTHSVTWTFPDGWNMQSHVFATNPDGGSWTWGDIDDLQIGVEKETSAAPNFPHVSQMYVEVTYESGYVCGDYAFSGNMPLCTGYGLFEYAWLENPWTSAAWTWDDVDDMQVGFECSSPSVVMSPFPMLPIADGDRTDITNVTTGYEHWEAVEKTKPYAEVFESGAAWKYDLYKFIQTTNDPNSYSNTVRGHVFQSDYLFTCCIGDGLYIHKLNDNNKFEFVLRQNDGALYQDIATDGTYYYVAADTGIFVYSFDGESLSLLDSVATGAQTVYCYGDYIYVGHGTSLKIYTFSGSTLTEINNETVVGNIAGIYHDDTYFYVSTSGGMLYAMSFDGTTITNIDSDNTANLLGDNLYGIDGDGSYIYAPAMTDGIYAYSFNGVALTHITKKDDGGTYDSVACFGDYIITGVEDVNDMLKVYTFDGTAFSAVIATHTFGASGSGVMWEIKATNGFIFSGWNALYVLSFSDSGFKEITNTSEDNTPKYLNDNITSVTVVAKMGKDLTAADQADIRGCFNIKTHATEYDTSANYFTLESVQRYYAYTWTTNPNTSAAWTLAEVQALQAGIGLYGTGTKYAICSRCYIVISAGTNISPEIHTCQTCMKVNYTPDASTCTLAKPTEISTNHARNVKMMNFWDGSREVYDLNRSGKSMVLSGDEYSAGSCDKIICMRDMTRDGTVITISGLNPQYFNGDYRINQFGWNKISSNPEKYKWVMDLEGAN